MIVMVYLLQWSLQDNQHVHKRNLNEKNSSWVPLHLSAQVIDYLIFPAIPNMVLLLVINYPQ